MARGEGDRQGRLYHDWIVEGGGGYEEDDGLWDVAGCVV